MSSESIFLSLPANLWPDTENHSLQGPLVTLTNRIRLDFLSYLPGKNLEVCLDISKRFIHCVIVKPVFVLVGGLGTIPQACWEIISEMPTLATPEAYWPVAAQQRQGPGIFKDARLVNISPGCHGEERGNEVL